MAVSLHSIGICHIDGAYFVKTCAYMEIGRLKMPWGDAECNRVLKVRPPDRASVVFVAVYDIFVPCRIGME